MPVEITVRVTNCVLWALQAYAFAACSFVAGEARATTALENVLCHFAFCALFWEAHRLFG